MLAQVTAAVPADIHPDIIIRSLAKAYGLIKDVDDRETRLNQTGRCN